ncbi:hypothetical protein ACQ4PT_011410 [Festuca glaucescens]
MSRPLVHAVEVEGPAGLPEGPQAGVRMDDVPGKPGTRLGLFFRSLQFICASITLTVTVTTDFTAIPCFVVAATSLLCLWSLSMAILDAYALCIGRRLRRRRLGWFFIIGDGIIGLVVFTAASMAGGTSYFVSTDMKWCVPSICRSYQALSVFAFFSFFAVLLSFFLNVSSWASNV